jgi:predicted acyl esterase
VLRRLAPLLAALSLTAGAAPAAAAPEPFGHACRDQDGVRFCPTPDDDHRVPTWDGIPLDVDVTLPATGDGPFPTIVMLHGFPGSKSNFEGVDDPSRPGVFHYNNTYLASRGYAVVNYSARGFGRSCGIAASRTANCAKGWTHLFDQRFEGRDTQYLLGLLVDQGIARAGALGVTGVSSGGVQSLELAYLRNRVRLRQGGFARWKSPRGLPLAITAAFSRWPGNDMLAALEPNGRYLDFRVTRHSEGASPLGIPNQSFIGGLFLAADLAGFIAPAGADPNADLRTWRDRTLAGEPYGADVRAIAREINTYHDSSSLTGTPAPLIVQNGWADDLFPVREALRVYNSVRRASPRAPISLQFGDTGHARGGAHLNQERAFNDQGVRFFDFWLRRHGRPPAPGGVLAFLQRCPRGVDSGGGPFSAGSWTRIHPGAVSFGGVAARTVRSDGGNVATASAFNPIFGTSDACKEVPFEHAPGTGVYELGSRGFTMLGRPTVRATIATRGRFGQLDSRLWDVDPVHGTQLLVTRGAYRLLDDQRGTITFQLNGNGWIFAPRHRIKLELLGNDAGNNGGYLRASNGAFSVRVTRLTIELPTHERPSRARGIGVPRLARLR